MRWSRRGSRASFARSKNPDPRVSGHGWARLRAAGIEVVVEIDAQEARRDHLGHILRVTQGRPMVTLQAGAHRRRFRGGRRARSPARHHRRDRQPAGADAAGGARGDHGRRRHRARRRPAADRAPERARPEASARRARQRAAAAVGCRGWRPRRDNIQRSSSRLRARRRSARRPCARAASTWSGRGPPASISARRCACWGGAESSIY